MTAPVWAASENIPSPVGHWISVDFVQHVEDFRPGKKTFRSGLYLKDIEFKPGGKTSAFYTWKDQWIFDQNGQFKSQFYIKTIDGTDYLFPP